MIETLKNDVVAAMKSGDKLKVTCLRMVLAEVKNASIEKKRELDKGEILAILQKSVKKREEAAAAFAEGNRAEMAEKEKKEAEMLRQYLPEGMSSEEMESIVEVAIAEAGATSKSEMGAVMKIIMSRYRGRVDGKQVQELVSGKLP